MKTYTLVVTCVVLRQNKHGAMQALILKRSDNESEGPGLWTIPGGKVSRKDWGKSVQSRHATGKAWSGVLERAIRREIQEETGIAVRKTHLLTKREKVFLRKDGTPTLVVVFLAVCSPRAAVKLGEESTGYAWVLYKDLKCYTFIGNVRSDIAFAFKALKRKT